MRHFLSTLLIVSALCLTGAAPHAQPREQNGPYLKCFYNPFNKTVVQVLTNVVVGPYMPMPLYEMTRTVPVSLIHESAGYWSHCNYVENAMRVNQDGTPDVICQDPIEPCGTGTSEF